MKMRYLKVSKKKNINYYYVCEDGMSLTITVCHHSASLVMPNDDPLIYSYNISHRNILNALIAGITVVPTKSDSDVILCLQLLSKTLTCTLHLS